MNQVLIAVAFAAALAACGSPAQTTAVAEAGVRTEPPPANDTAADSAARLVMALVATPPRDRATVQRVFGSALTDPPARGWGENVRYGALTIEKVDQRMVSTRPGEPWFFILYVDEDSNAPERCVPQADIVSRFPGWTRGFSMATDGGPTWDTWWRNQSWGSVMFLFGGKDHGCLESVVFSSDPHTEG